MEVEPPSWEGLEPWSPDASAIGRANPRRDTRCELAVRSAVHRLGGRFRKDHPIRWGDGPRQITTADLAFPRARVAVFVDGCFWHGCPLHLHAPRHNAAYWVQKLAANRARDARNTAALEARGWAVLRFWEHEHPIEVATFVLLVVEGRRKSSGPSCEGPGARL